MRTVRIKLHTIDDLRHKAKNFAITEFKRKHVLELETEDYIIELMRHSKIEFLPNGQEFKK